MATERKWDRSVGILMPISSLPGPYGIGTLGKEAFAFVDFAREMEYSYWQVLPVGPTGYGDSPYQSCSLDALNPYFIDFDLLAEDAYTVGKVLEATCYLMSAKAVWEKGHEKLKNDPLFFVDVQCD